LVIISSENYNIKHKGKMKIKLVIELYNIITPELKEGGWEDRVLKGGVIGGYVLKKENVDWNLPFELKSDFQLGILPGFGPLVVAEVRNEGTLEEPKIVVELRYKVFEDNPEGWQSAIKLFMANGFVEGKTFVDTRSAVLIFPKKAVEHFNRSD